MQGLGRRCTGSGTTADAGTSKKIRGQSAPRVGYSGSRVSRRQPGRRRHHEGCSRVDGYVSGVRASAPTGNREVVGTNHRMSEEVKAVSGVLIPVESSPAAAVPLTPAAGKPGAKKEVNDFPFAVAVGDVYEGPLDLLLDLIRKQDIDIYDIPIAKITAQYLSYVERMRELAVNVAADFIYMAAVLIHIKSKMLLPRDPLAPAEAQEDPRSELVNRLLEHEKFKSAAQMLLQKQQIEDAVWSNPSLKEFIDDEGAEPELAADVIDLVKTFQQVLERVRTRPVLNVDEETVTVGQMIDYLRRRLSLEDRPIRLKQLLMRIPSRQALVCMFLALLEMVRLQAIQVRQDRLFGEIAVRKHTHFDEIMNERAAIRDDWR